MLNKEVFVKDPTSFTLPNAGVADVAVAADAILRHELSSFVCDGQYAEGLVRILDSYLQSLGRSAAQPCVWISGFYGSGKSHLLKVLAHLWTDEKLSDGASPRGLVSFAGD